MVGMAQCEMMNSDGIRECHLVTGGGGYVGSHLGRALHDLGHDVVLLDVREPKIFLSEGMRFIKGDISDFDTISSAFDGVDCVYHLASFGMSGREQLNKGLIEKINVQGTENVIKACQQSSTCRLVYTSTYNVVFGGQEINNGDESLPYWPIDKHPDHYSRTKAFAEMKVLKANGVEVKNGDQLKTCSLRLAGVYGPGEERHLPRIVSYIQKGLFVFTYGSKDSLVEFLHINNLVQAHVLAGQKLKDKNSCVAGEAYFISDCKPINNFEFFRPLIEGLGYSFPTIQFPVSLIFFFAFITEIIHSIVGKLYNFQPLLTRAEVFKTGITHYFSIDKAKKHLGYKPSVQNDMNSVVQWYKERGYGRKIYISRRWTIQSIAFAILLSFLFTSGLLSWLPTVR